MADNKSIQNQAKSDAQSVDYNPRHTPTFVETVVAISTLGISDIVGATHSHGYTYKDDEKKVYDSAYNRELHRR